jgi:hypothetical protein
MPDTKKPVLTVEEINAAIANLTPEKLLAVRALAQKSGLLESTGKLTKLADGSMRIVITVPVDLAQMLLNIAEAGADPGQEHAFIENIMLDGASGWFQGRGEEEPEPVAATK